MTKNKKNIDNLIGEFLESGKIYVLEHNYEKEDKAFKEAIEKEYDYIDYFNIDSKKIFIDKSIKNKLLVFDADEADFFEYFYKYHVDELILRFEGVEHKKITINETYEIMNEGHIIIDYGDLSLSESILRKINNNFEKIVLILFIFILLKPFKIINISKDITEKIDAIASPLIAVSLLIYLISIYYDRKKKKEMIKSLSTKERKKLEKDIKLFNKINKKSKLDYIIWGIVIFLSLFVLTGLLISYL